MNLACNAFTDKKIESCDRSDIELHYTSTIDEDDCAVHVLSERHLPIKYAHSVYASCNRNTKKHVKCRLSIARLPLH